MKVHAVVHADVHACNNDGVHACDNDGNHYRILARVHAGFGRNHVSVVRAGTGTGECCGWGAWLAASVV